MVTIALLMALPSSQARAATLSVSVEVPGLNSPFVADDDWFTTVRQVAPVDLADQDIPTDHPNIWCRIRRKEITAYVAHTRALLPRLPVTASCTYDGNTLEITVTEMPPSADPTYDPPQFTAEQTATLRRDPGALVANSFDVVNGVHLVHGEQTPGTLHRTSCEANVDQGTSSVLLIVEPSAEDGRTMCTLTTTEGASTSFSFDISSARARQR